MINAEMLAEMLAEILAEILAKILAEILAEIRPQELRRRCWWQQLLSYVCYSKSYVMRGV